MNSASTGSHELLTPNILEGLFGVEIEEHRVQLERLSLSQHPHSPRLGDRRTQPYFQTDFSESQEEVVTSAHPSPKAALQQLHELQTILISELAADEVIWPLSMPPRLATDDVNFLLSHFERIWYQEYRDVLTKRYGPYQHIMTGVHVNYSPSPALVAKFQRTQGLANTIAAKNQLYFQIAQQVVAYRWLLTYLFGASPVSENLEDQIPSDQRFREPVRSWRASDFGFANHADIKIGYTNLSKHLAELQAALTNKRLYDRSEFYGPVRLKNSGALAAIKTDGIDYLEFRMFDIDPFSRDGISAIALNFLHLLIVDAIIHPQGWSAEELTVAKNDNHQVAISHPDQGLPPHLVQTAAALLTRTKAIVELAPSDIAADLQNAWDYAHAAISASKLTVSGQLLPHIKNNSLLTFGMSQGVKLRQEHPNEASAFPTIPKDLLANYQEAYRLGFKPTITGSGELVISRQGHQWMVTRTTDLRKYVTEDEP